MRTASHVLGAVLLVACSACGGDVTLPAAGSRLDSGALAPSAQSGHDQGVAPKSLDVKPSSVSQPTADQHSAPPPDTRPPPDQQPPAPKTCPCGAGYLCVMGGCHPLCTPAGACKVDSTCPATEACVEAYQNAVFVGHVCYPAAAGKGQACSSTMCQNHLICLSSNGGPYTCQPCP